MQPLVFRDESTGRTGVVLLSSAATNGGYSGSVGAGAGVAAAYQSQQSAWQSATGSSSAPGGIPIPQMENVSPQRPPLKSLGATGTAIFGGVITSEEYNEDFYWKDAITIYEQMIRNDAQIFAVAQLLELPIRRATWSIEPASDDPRDKEIAAFVESCLFHDMRYRTATGRVLTQKWDDILRHILMMLRFGFMPFEQVWRIEDGWVKWARWTPLLPRTIWRWWVGPDNELAGVQQWTFKQYTYQFVDIPADKLLLFVHRQEGNNFEGFSVLRPAYKHWYYKDNYYKIEAIDIERNAVAIPVIYLPESYSDTDVINAQAILANMRVNEQLGITLPPGWQIEYIRNMQRTTAQVQPSIQHHDIMIARAILAPFLNLGSTETGSYNLSETQMDLFRQSLQAECEYVEDVVSDDAIPRLVDYNYDGVENYPRLKCSKIAAQDVEKIANALSKLAANLDVPYIHPDPELEDFLRNELGLPKAPVSPVEGTNPTAPDNPARPENAERADDHEDTESSTTPGGRSTSDETPDDDGDGTGDSGSSGAGNASSADGSTAAGAAASGDGSTSAASEANTLTTELRLLREAWGAIAGDMDAVERGATSAETQATMATMATIKLYNPNHDPHNGQFTSGPGGASAGGTSSKSSGKSSAGKGSTKGTKAAKSGAKASAGASASPKVPKASSVGASSGAGAAPPTHSTHSSVVKNGTLEVTHHTSGNKTVVEPDHNLGGYTITTHDASGHELSKMEGASATTVNAYLKGATGKSNLFGKAEKAQVAPGAKKTAAEKQAYKDQQTFAAKVPKGGNVAEEHYTNSVDYTHFKGDQVSVIKTLGGNGYNVIYKPAMTGKVPSYLKPMEGWKAAVDNGNAVVTHAHDAKAVNDILAQHGITNSFDESKFFQPAGWMSSPFAPSSSSSSSSSSSTGLPSGLSPHSTMGYTASMLHNVSAGKIVAEGTAKGLGHYEITHGKQTVEIERTSNNGFTLRYHGGKQGDEEVKGLTADEAKQHLESRGIKDAQSKHFVDFAEHDYTRYGGSKGSKTPEQQARIDAVAARKAALDAKFGAKYSDAKARQLMTDIYAQYKGSEVALETHLTGGAHLQASSIAAQMKGNSAKAHEALDRMHEVTEWSLLHSPKTTREGTIRLFHGTNGKSDEAKWSGRLLANGAKRGTPFTDHWSVARAFADPGKHGPMIISAHVPVENIITHQRIRTDNLYPHEYEYTVGRGAVNDFQFVKLK